MTTTPHPTHNQPIVFRNGLVLTMDDAHTTHENADVLVIGETIAEVGPNLAAPEGTFEIDAKRGIIMPGMVDTHRHMWQSAMRAYGADWTLTQYFVWYYLQHGKHFRPQDTWAGNAISALDAIESGITTTVDWSHGLRSVEHGEAALDALISSPGRFVLGFGNIFAGPWEWSVDPAYRALRRPAGLRRHRRPGVPGASRVRVGPRTGPLGHDPRRCVGRDQRRRHPSHVRERVHA
jgi:cytosine/adenosine deaminase-related metal-dependent hydrolase